jgi:glycosyltransferase involved in cell wall biosynthesis
MSSLVSVIIATYNSSPFIIETLESVSRQTWKELELIITDDCSIDNTVELCRQWIKGNDHRFIRTEIITSKINTGVSKNVNRGLYAAKSDWIKFLGADDTLKNDCIENNILWINTNPRVRALFSQIEVYRDTFDSKNLLKVVPCIEFIYKSILAPDRSVDSQYRMLLVSDRIHFSPSLFLHRETFLSVDGADERFRFLEDYPLWLKLTKNGHKLYFMNKVTVNYRQHSKAINNTGRDLLVNPNYFRTEDFRRICTYPYLPIDIRLNQSYTWYASQIFRFDWLNKNNKLNKFILGLLTIYLNPLRYFIWLRKHFNKNLNDNEFYI